MRGHLTRTLVVAATIVAAVAIFWAGGLYFVDYPEWDAAAATYVYRERPFAESVLIAAAVTSVIVLVTGLLAAVRVEDDGRIARTRGGSASRRGREALPENQLPG